METLIRALRENGICFEEYCPLSKHSTFRIGGPARVAVFPKTKEELLCTLQLARSMKIRFSVLGNGSNVVFSDVGYDGMIVFTTAYRSVKAEDNVLIAAAGASLASVASLALQNGLTGMEFAAGIPGTVGGGVFMNAGAFDGCIGKVCMRSCYWDADTDTVSYRQGEEQRFGTRTSIYEQRTDDIILEAEFSLSLGDGTDIRRKMEDYALRRKNTQPLELPSAGSVFKRPVGYYAGRLIEECNLKGYTVGGACVSEKHAGFIVNKGGATCEDVKRLVKEIQDRVLSEKGVLLECEIRFLEA